MNEPITFTVRVEQDTDEYAGGPYTNVSFSFDAEGYSFFSYLCDGTTGDVLEAQAANVPGFARLDPCYERAAKQIAQAANHHWRKA